MKMLLFIVSLMLSLLNLIAGLAILLLGKVIASHGVLEVLDAIFNGLLPDTPWAAVGIVVLLLLGCITETRPYAAIVAFALNAAALVLVLVHTGFPTDLGQGLIFLPVLLALTGFAWIAYNGLAPQNAD